MPSSSQNPKFRTPFRHNAKPRFSSQTDEPEVTPKNVDCESGDMLDLIRSQRSSQYQPACTPGLETKRKTNKIPKRQLFADNHANSHQTLDTAEVNQDSEPESVRMPSEVYEFSVSPPRESGQCRGKTQRKRLAEKQVLRTIFKMSEEIKEYRSRLDKLRQQFPGLVGYRF